jgi:hypothetical protein
MRVRLVLVVGFALVAGACTQGPSVGGPAPDRSEHGDLPVETLLLGTDTGPLAISSPGGAVLSSFPGAIASADGTAFYATTPLADATVLETIAPVTGQTRATVNVPGALQVRVVSGSGRATALTEPLPDGWDPWTPIPRDETTIVVADPTGASRTRTFVLDGNYEPEAFSVDDRRLFLIQHLPPLAPTVYRVTVLDLARERVFPVYGPFKSAPERMPGTRLQQELAPRGDQLYTLYSSARPGYAPHDAPVASDAVVSFVHVLSLDEGWAHCVGLPEAMWDRPSSALALAASADGRHLYVIDAGTGLVAVMNTRTLQVRTARIDPPVSRAIERTTAEMSADGSTLFLGVAGDGSVVTSFDVATLRVLDRWTLQGDVSSLGLSPDGTRLYAAVEGGMAVLDSSTGRELGRVPVAATGDVLSVQALAG